MNENSQRRRVLRRMFGLGPGLAVALRLGSTDSALANTTQADPKVCFTLGRQNDRWWLITSDGKALFAIGLNPIDPASLRYPENIDIWREFRVENVSEPLIESFAIALIRNRGTLQYWPARNEHPGAASGYPPFLRLEPRFSQTAVRSRRGFSSAD